MAETSGGRVRRKAERIAQKASGAAGELRRSGIETPEERRDREARESRQAEWEARESRARLSERLVSLLHLLLSDGKPPAESVAVLRGLAMADADGYLRIEIPAIFASSSPLLVEGYEKSRRIFAEVATRALQKEWQSIEQALKTVAVDLMSAGAEVRGLKADVVPLVAYSLFSGHLPDPPDASFSVAAQQVDNLLLSIADDVATMPTHDRPLFIGLFRLAVLIGEAQAYTEKLSMTALSF